MFFLTRFSAAFRFGRDKTLSIRSEPSLPGCSLPLAAVGASALRLPLGASPLPMNGSSSCLAICGVAPSRLERASPSFTFGPLLPASPAATTTSADSSLRCPQRRPFRREARSPQVRASTFAARPPDLRLGALAIEASRYVARSPRPPAPCIRFLFVGPRLRSPLPPHARSPSRSCGSLRLRWPAHERTCTSWLMPTLGAQLRRPPRQSRGASQLR